MKGMKRILLLCLCFAAIITATVFGTMAYLMDSDSAVNTFTVGKVDITVDETKVNPDGTTAVDPDAERVKSNEYHLLPGMTYLKDPTVTLLEDSEDAYIRMILTVHCADQVQAIVKDHQLEDYSVFLGEWDKEVWLYKGFSEDKGKNTISFEFRYKEIVPGADSDTSLLPLFKKLIVPGEVTGEEIQKLHEGNFKLEIFGHAIQASGFAERTDEQTGEVKTAEDAAWEAFDKQIEKKTPAQPEASKAPEGTEETP